MHSYIFACVHMPDGHRWRRLSSISLPILRGLGLFRREQNPVHVFTL